MNEPQLNQLNEDIIYMIEEKARVLDIGCGDGDLLKTLWDRKQVYGLGLDINIDAVLKCIKKGVSVIHEDIDEGLAQYKDNSYDYVILSETLQTVKRPDFVLNQIVRIGKKAIVSFPNYAHFLNRFQMMFLGKMPKSEALPFEWHNTPNIHLVTIKDFKIFCRANGINILKEKYYSDNSRESRKIFSPNWFAESGLFLIQKG